MSHDLDTSTGKPAMAYVGETPWHGLGERLSEGQGIDVWLQAARLDWQIQMLPAQYQFDGRTRVVPERFVLARSDTGDALSVVSGDYQVVQPKEVLEFYRNLIAVRHYKLETAGALDEGRKVWALARTGLVAKVAGNAADELGAYVLLATSCDKSLATTLTFTSIRVVCQNTLAFAFKDVSANKRRSIKVDHTRKFDPEPIKEELGLIDEAWEKFMDQVNSLAAYRLDDAIARAYFLDLFRSDKEIEKGKPLSDAKHREVEKLFSSYTSPSDGGNIVTAQGTLWGALNAVTYHVDPGLFNAPDFASISAASWLVMPLSSRGRFPGTRTRRGARFEGWRGALNSPALLPGPLHPAKPTGTRDA